jgi:hypothetical protein
MPVRKGNNMNKLAIIALTLSVFSACAAKKTVAKEESHSEIKESYQYGEANCSTGKHEFAGADKDKVRDELCEALQDSKLNNGCAEQLRLDAFQQKCSGKQWNPK